MVDTRQLIVLAGSGFIGFIITGVFVCVIALIFAYWKEGVHAQKYYGVMVFFVCAASIFIVSELGWDDGTDDMKGVSIAFSIGGMIAIVSVLWDVIPISKIFSRIWNRSGQ